MVNVVILITDLINPLLLVVQTVTIQLGSRLVSLQEETEFQTGNALAT